MFSVLDIFLPRRDAIMSFYSRFYKWYNALTLVLAIVFGRKRVLDYVFKQFSFPVKIIAARTKKKEYNAVNENTK